MSQDSDERASERFFSVKPLEPAEPRFYIYHGVIHDRETGKHVRTDTPNWLNDDGINEALALLNSLAANQAR